MRLTSELFSIKAILVLGRLAHGISTNKEEELILGEPGKIPR